MPAPHPTVTLEPSMLKVCTRSGNLAAASVVPLHGVEGSSSGERLNHQEN